MSAENELIIRNAVDENGNPAGGFAEGIGMVVAFQDGPLRVDGELRERNGCFVEDLIRVAIARMEFYQSSRFACDQNAITLEHLELALESQISRTAEREERGVEGTHEV
jgi:hypothetical protein